MIIRQSWYALILLGGWHACRALLVCAELGRCWEQGSIKEWVHSQVPDLRFEGEILVVGSYRINAIAGARIFAARESHGFGCCGQFSPGQHAHQSCLRIGSAEHELGLKSGCRFRCPGLGCDA